jgi:hypothetical protein
MAEMMSAPARPFVNTYKDEVHEMKRLMLAYVKALRLSPNPGVPVPTGTSPDSVVPAGTSNQSAKFQSLPMTEAGFPILPVPWIPGNYTKDDLERLFTLYLGQHYSMCEIIVFDSVLN